MENIPNKYDFSLLPPHVLAQILSSLPFRQMLSASQTCRSWYFASCDPIISKRILVQITNNFESITKITRPFGTLVLRDTKFNENNGKILPPNVGQYVTEIKFINCTLSAKQFADCLIIMTNLMQLEIASRGEIFSSSLNLIESDVAAVRPILNRIKHFRVFHLNSNIIGLRMIMNMMTNLKTLHFDLPYKELVSFTYPFKLEKLKIITLTEVGSDFVIRDLVKNFKLLNNLSSFELSSYFTISYGKTTYGENFNSFCKKLTNLRRLSIHSIGKNKLADICRHLPQLVELNIEGLPTNKIQVIGNLRNLQKLSLTKLDQKDSSVLSEMLKPLEKLIDFEIDCEITSVMLNVICSNCVNLERLELPKVATHNLEVLFRNLVKLTHLDLKFVKRDICQFNVDQNVTNLNLLQYLYVDLMVPGLSIELFETLPNLKRSSLQFLKLNIHSFRHNLDEV